MKFFTSDYFILFSIAFNTLALALRISAFVVSHVK